MVKAIVVLVVTTLGFTLLGCNSQENPKVSVGQAVDDTVITAKIKAAFLNEPEVKSADISVETVTGTVTLTGSVASEAQSQRANSIARAIEGVKNVENKLTVKQAYNAPASKRQFATLISAAVPVTYEIV
jgi:hyperosmotically inducible periplasmic protein